MSFFRLRFPRPIVLRPADHLLARAAFWIALGLFLWTLVEGPGTLDSEARYQGTRSVALGQWGRLEPETPEARAVLDAELVVLNGDGRQSLRAPWMQLPAVPLWWAGTGLAKLAVDHEAAHSKSPPVFTDPWTARPEGPPPDQRSEYFAHLASGLVDPLAGAAMWILLVFTARRLGASRRASLACAFAFGTTTFWWPQTTGDGGWVLPSLALFAGYASAIEARARFARFEAPRGRLWLSHGLATAIVFWGSPDLALAALACIGLGLWVAIAGRRRLWSSPLLRGEAGAAKALGDSLWIVGPWLGLGAVHLGWATFLGTLDSAWPFAGAQPLWEHPEPLSRAAALWIGPGEGLLWCAPLLFVGLWSVFVRRTERFIVGSGLTLALAVLFGAGGGAALDDGFGPGVLLPALAPLWLWTVTALGPLAARRSGRLALGGAALFGLAVNGPGLAVSHPTYAHLARAHGVALELLPNPGPEPAALPAATAWDAFDRDLQWDLRWAQPWAQWRILRHRAAGLPESFSLGRLFFSDAAEFASPARSRDEGFGHLAWVDLEDRLGGPIWPGVLLALICLGWGTAAAVSALDPTRP